MTEKPDRSAFIRLLNAVCAVVLVISIVYVLIAGFELIALTAIACSLTGVAVPVALAAEGALEALAGIFEALIDGIVAIFDAIASLIPDIF